MTESDLQKFYETKYHRFLELLANTPKIRDSLIKAGLPIITSSKHGIRKVQTELFHQLYFRPNFVEIVYDFFHSQDPLPSTKKLVKLFELKQILRPSTPSTGYLAMTDSPKEEWEFLTDIADAFDSSIEALKTSSTSSSKPDIK